MVQPPGHELRGECAVIDKLPSGYVAERFGVQASRKTTAGPVINQYAAKVGASVEEVMAWIEDYINGPRSNWISAMCRAPIEETPAAREQSIRDYLKREVQ